MEEFLVDNCANTNMPGLISRNNGHYILEKKDHCLKKCDVLQRTPPGVNYIYIYA